MWNIRFASTVSDEAPEDLKLRASHHYVPLCSTHSVGSTRWEPSTVSRVALTIDDEHRDPAVKKEWSQTIVIKRLLNDFIPWPNYLLRGHFRCRRVPATRSHPKTHDRF